MEKFDYLNGKETVIVSDQLQENVYVLETIWKEEANSKEIPIIEKKGVLTEDHANQKIYLYLGEKKEIKKDNLKSLILQTLIKPNRDLQVNLSKVTSNLIEEIELFEYLYHQLLLKRQKHFSLKTKKPDVLKKVFIITNNNERDQKTQEIEEVAYAYNFARNLQILPPNIANSEYIAEKIEKDLSVISELKVKTLKKQELEKMGLNLLLSVNRGSTYEARMVVAEYRGNPTSEEVLALVGKGIAFDSGGYSLKPSTSMTEMKFDMSGAAIVASTIKLIAKRKLKKNVVAIMPITDNRVNGDASTPDSVWVSYNGKSVEVNNTDAEGRLILADGMAYAVKDLKATKIVTVATLTGAITFALGQTYTGFWATCEHDAEKVKTAAKQAEELVWQMPFHESFLKGFKKSKVADLMNTNYSEKCSAASAMFLKEFADNKNFIHFDIAGTAQKGGEPHSPLIKTLLNFTQSCACS